MNNNIDNLVFENHDTFVYETARYIKLDNS